LSSQKVKTWFVHLNKYVALFLAGSNNNITINAILQVIDNTQVKRHYLTACLKPMYLNSDWIGVLQYISMWQALGVTKFFLYIQQISPEVDRIIKIYENEGLVERIHYGFVPPTSNHIDVNLYMFGSDELLVVNDCLLRNRGVSEWVALNDLDEILVNRIDNGSAIGNSLINLVLLVARAETTYKLRNSISNSK